MSAPLAGRTVVVTRATDQAGSLSAALAAEGATVIELPVVAIADPADSGVALRSALASTADLDWIVVTSPNGARRVADALPADVDVRFAAVGPKTAEPLIGAGHPVHLVPTRAVAESLLDEFPAPPDTGGRVLLARAETGRDVLPDGLRAAGWTVDEVVAYRNVEPDVDPVTLADAQAADAVTFTAESTVRRFTDLVGGDGPRTAVCIGPISAAAAGDAGYDVHVAEPYSVAGLVAAAVRWAEPR